jgi:iron(III) transport system substrate-binding protein
MDQGAMTRWRTLLLIAALAFAAVAPAHATVDEAAARKEGRITWYVSQIDTPTADTAGHAFTALHPGIEVNVVRTTTQIAYQRLIQDLRGGAPQCDVYSTTDVGHYTALKQRGALAAYRPENAASLSPEFQNFDPDGTYFPTYSGLVVIAYNTKKLTADQAPKSWRALAEPAWKGKLSLGHPGFSGYVGNWVVELTKLYGWHYFEQIAQNDPLVSRSIIDTVTVLNAGERVVGVSPSPSALESIDKGNPLAVVYPEDGAILMIAPSAVLASAPHPNAARLFMEFLLSKDYAELSVKSRGESLRPDVAPLPGFKSFRDVKTVHLSAEEVAVGIPKVTEQWRDTFGG